MKKKSSLYRIWVKIENDKTITYRSSDLLNFTKFLNKSYPTWRFFNVYDKETGQQLASFTKSNQPQTKRVL
jgi:hypothetical protein